ncbi:lysozyme inhibitor LprI family protein [Pseudomonas sp. RL_15y_Pfl2_60]|uniref:lysozyme inhibitor LprI family protein n=1 Tax=Pseudomonas sp. RL_15y_Pfl2_60 TaxID=3088709 RepID=UPI0030D90B39
MKSIVFVALTAFSSLALADNCDKARDDFDNLYCLNKVYQEADKELNSAYGKLRAQLNDEQKNTLKRTQIAWINQRNDACSRREGSSFYVNIRCANDRTVARTNEINDRIRECKSTGCQASKL